MDDETTVDEGQNGFRALRTTMTVRLLFLAAANKERSDEARMKMKQNEEMQAAQKVKNLKRRS